MVNKSTAQKARATRRKSIDDSDPEQFLLDVLATYRKDVEFDEHNILPAREDIMFVVGDQWDARARAARTRLKKPVLTVNRLPAFVAQYIGGWLQNEVQPKLSPARGGTKTAAEIREGLLRFIMRSPAAKEARNRAMSLAYICGLGNYGLRLVDSVNDVFARDVEMTTFEDPYDVVWDRGAKSPSGADAQHVFTFEYMTREDFEEMYPDATSSDGGWYDDEWDTTLLSSKGWEIDELVRICNFWQMKYEPVTLGLEAETGDVIDITDWSEDQIAATIDVDNEGNLLVRETVKPYCELYVMTSSEILEGPFRLDISRVPVFRVQGWTMYEGPTCYRWGFVRNAKDPQRLHNWWRSVVAEELRKSVSGKWLLDKANMKGGLEAQFRQAHLTDDNILVWDSEAGGQMPHQLPPPQINQAVLTEAASTVQDIKDVTNKHEASFGIQGNEVSGKAITARQRVSELGDVIYIQNMNAADAECAKVINELIPVVYDTNRTIKIIGEDDTEILQEINGMFGDKTPDITVGRYDLTYTTGPSYATKRQESVDMMMTLMNTMPQTANVISDIIVRNMDIPGADEISARLAMLMPPGMVDIEKLPKHMQPLAKQRADQQAQQAQQQQQMGMAQFMAQMQKMAAEIEELKARAKKQEAQADVSESEVGMRAVEAEVKADANDIDAAKVGVTVDQLGHNAFKMGLDAATAQQTYDDQSEKMDKASDAAEGEQDDGEAGPGQPNAQQKPVTGAPGGNNGQGMS